MQSAEQIVAVRGSRAPPRRTSGGGGLRPRGEDRPGSGRGPGAAVGPRVLDEGRRCCRRSSPQGATDLRAGGLPRARPWMVGGDRFSGINKALSWIEKLASCGLGRVPPGPGAPAPGAGPGLLGRIGMGGRARWGDRRRPRARRLRRLRARWAVGRPWPLMACDEGSRAIRSSDRSVYATGLNLPRARHTVSNTAASRRSACRLNGVPMGAGVDEKGTAHSCLGCVGR